MTVTIVSSYPPAQDGVAYYSYYLSRELAEQGLDVVIFGNEQARQTCDKIRVQRVWRSRRPLSLFKVASTSLKEKTDIVHIQFHPALFGGIFHSAFLSLVVLTLKMLRRRIVITFHTIRVLSKTDRSRAVSLALKFGMKLLALSSDAIIVHTAPMRNVLVREYGLDSKKITVVPMGVKKARVMNSDEAKEALGFKGKICLMTPALLRKGTGIKFVMKALPRIAREIPNVLYVVSVVPPAVYSKAEEDLRELVEMRDSLGLANKVSFLGKFLGEAPEEESLWLNSADIIISLHENYPSEDSSLSIGDCLAYGKVIVVSDAPKFREVGNLLTYLGARTLVIPNELSDDEKIDRIVKAVCLCTSPFFDRDRLSRELMVFVNERTWDKVARQIATIYKQVNSPERLGEAPERASDVKSFNYFQYLRRFYERKCIVEYFDDYFKTLSTMKNHIVLDAGCGIGQASRRLTDSGNFVISVDINLHSLLYGSNSKAIENPILGHVCAFPIRDSYVDLVLFLDVVEHLERPLLSMREIRRILKRKGTLCLITPNGIYSRILSRGKEFADSTHVREYTWSELKYLLKRAGFSIAWARASGLPFLNRISLRLSRRVARTLGRIALPIACTSFWVTAERPNARDACSSHSVDICPTKLTES